ncbi:MAG: hypothetical protein AAFY54_11170 [Cyanobacteria bacterium J06648_10]
MLEFLQKIWQFALDNADIALAIVGATTGGLGWLGSKLRKRLKQKKAQLAITDTFPFEVIRPKSSDVVQRIYGSRQQTLNDPLADFNIKYQQRLAALDMQQVLMERLLVKGWLLILGRTGLGKTREAAELA